MAVVRAMNLVRRGVQGGLAAALLAALLSAGCVKVDEEFWRTSKKPRTGVSCEVVCVWQNTVSYVPDPVRHGAPGPGFLGRVYLFDQEFLPVIEDGRLVVDLIDESGKEPKWVERWDYDPVTFKRFVKEDRYGWGYTVFLPSGRYQPGMTKIRLRTSFQGTGRAPIYSENVVTLDEANGVLREGTPMATPSLRPTSPPGPAPVPPKGYVPPPRITGGNAALPPPTPVK